jgi:hypothetical protein
MSRSIYSMFKLIVFLIGIPLCIMNCSGKKAEPQVNVADNAEIEAMFLKDIEIRELDARTDTVVLERYDQVHRNKIFEMLANKMVITPMDQYRAALILQHTAGKFCEGQLTSVSPENFLLAYHLSSSALASLEAQQDTLTINKHNFPRMVALNYDRYLLYTNGYQKYGTQFVFDDQTGEMLLAPIDTTLATDKERQKYHVKPLKELMLEHKLKPLPVTE